MIEAKDYEQALNELPTANWLTKWLPQESRRSLEEMYALFQQRVRGRAKSLSVAREAEPAQVTEAAVERALHARVPGGAQVRDWLPMLDDAKTSHETAFVVMQAALAAAYPALTAQVAEAKEHVGAVDEENFHLKRDRDRLAAENAQIRRERDEYSIQILGADGMRERAMRMLRHCRFLITRGDKLALSQFDQLIAWVENPDAEENPLYFCRTGFGSVLGGSTDSIVG